MPRHVRPLALLLVLLIGGGPSATAAETVTLSDQVVMRLAAVAETSEGLVGATASATITVATNGSGHVFLDTFPLTQVDMQGSARLAARVAAQLAGKRLEEADFFFVIRSSSQQIGGPSAGAALTVGAVAALNGWKVRDDVLMTGTINPDGTVGPVGGIPEKAQAAANARMRVFLYPEGQEVSALQGNPRQAVNMTRYCETQLDIQCVAIGDVRDAFVHMTDYAIERPRVTGNVTGEVFMQKLAPLSQELVDQAARLVDEATDAVGALPRDSTRDSLAESLGIAADTLRRARDATSNGTHYTASSLSFQASIRAHSVRDQARFLASGTSALNVAVREARSAVDAARREIDATQVTDSAVFESAGAAQDRLMQAEASLAEAEALIAAGGFSGTLQGIDTAAFAAERADTARWWLKIGENAPGGQPVNAEQLEATARDTLTASQEVVAYVEAVFASAQAGATLTDAREKLTQAEAALDRGYYPGAMMLALEGEVRASALLKLASFGTAPESIFEAAQENAAVAIQQARERGVEPLLAQSVYEFSFAQDNPVERLAFLGMARVSANLAGLPGLLSEPMAATSRFQGIPANVGVPVAYLAAAFAVGLAMGAGVGLAALMPRTPAPREEDPDGVLVDPGLRWPREE